MKRVQLTKVEVKQMRKRQAEEMQGRADQMDDLKAIHQIIGGGREKGRDEDSQGGGDRFGKSFQ
jgi:hypothetical protein